MQPVERGRELAIAWVTGTLSASMVCGPTEPVSEGRWRAWKRFTASSHRS